MTDRRRWLREAPELFAVVLGIALRLAGRDYDPRWGYDFAQHWKYVEYLSTHHALPPPSYGTAAYHPPLYYWLMSMLGSPSRAQAFSILAGIVRLLVLWIGLRLLLPKDRLARVAAILLAGVLPCALHLDLMVTNEALNALLGTAALLLLILLLRARRMAHGVAAGLVIGAMLWTKVSGLVPLGLAGLIAVVALISPGDADWRERIRGARAPLTALGLALLVGLPFHFWRRPQTGALFVSSPYQTVPEGIAYAQPFETIPYLRRQPPTYAFGFGRGEIFRQIPCHPSDIDRFLPVLLASSFGDYYNQWFSGLVDSRLPSVMVNDRPMETRTIGWLRASIYAGTLIAAATGTAWLAAAVVAWRRRSAELGLLLLPPLLATLGQLHFAIKYPFPHAGMIKGHYIQFAAAPLFGLFGVAVSFAWQRHRLRPLAIVLLGALAVVAAYTLDARTALLR